MFWSLFYEWIKGSPERGANLSEDTQPLLSEHRWEPVACAQVVATEELLAGL